MRAIYKAGGTIGIAQALQDEGRASEVVLVAHDGTPEKNALLLDWSSAAYISLPCGFAIGTLRAQDEPTPEELVRDHFLPRFIGPLNLLIDSTGTNLFAGL
jgi:hypothetical protein